MTWEKGTKTVELILLAFGIIIAYTGLTHYRNSTLEATNSRLSTLDRDAYTASLTDDHLNVLFADYPEPSTKEEAKAIADKLIELTAGEENPHTPIAWGNIPQLYEFAYSINNFNDKRSVALRKASTHADLVFYTVEAAFSAMQLGILPYDYYQSWQGYLRDAGKNPIFLLSIYIAYKYKYIDSDFCAELRTTLLNNNKSRLMVHAVYPEMLSPNWATNINNTFSPKPN